MDGFFKTLDENERLLDSIFKNDATLKKRRFTANAGGAPQCVLFFIDGMASGDDITSGIVRPVDMWQNAKGYETARFIAENVIHAGELSLTRDRDQAIEAMLSGDTIVLVDGDDEAIVADTKGFPMRGTDTPENERSVRGPRDGFGESIIPNLALLRRRLATNRLKMKFTQVGGIANNSVCIIWLEGVTDKRVLAELEKRMSGLKFDAVLDVNYIQETVRDAKYSPFKLTGTTERPDVLAARLLEGRAAVMVDGSPAAMTVPYLFIENFQSADDYYINYWFSAVSRFLRIIGFFFSILTPGLYVALVTAHREMIPTHLLLAISASREGVPFPTAAEVIILLFAFEVLREAGARMPQDVGTALSVVGALILGQAAVEARFVSAPVVIIAAFAGITALMAPKIQGAMTAVRLLLTLLGAFFGLYGVMLGLVLLGAHLASVSSFGVPSLAAFAGGAAREDIFFRPPWFSMKKSGRFISRDGGKI